MAFDGKEFDRVLKETLFQALFKEIEQLREWYFYDEKHTQVNRAYYKFIEKLADEELSVDRRLRLAVSTFRKFYQYMCIYYPKTGTIDVDLLTEDVENDGTMKVKKKRGRPSRNKLSN